MYHRRWRDEKHYKTRGHKTFADYCQVVWQMERRHAYRLIDAAAVHSVLCPIGHILPANEAVARPLAQIVDEDPKIIESTWKKTIKVAEAEAKKKDKPLRITAKHVEAVIKDREKAEKARRSVSYQTVWRRKKQLAGD